MQTRNIFCKLPVVIIIAITVTCTVGIIVVFNYHEMFETDAVKVTSNTSNTQNDPTDGDKTVASLNTIDGINSTSNENNSNASNTSNDGKPDPTVSERTAVHTTHQYSPNFVPGSTFSQNDPGNGKTRYVYDSTRIDADGDGAADDVLLVGENNDPSASFGNQTRNLAVVVRDGVIGKFDAYLLPEDFGVMLPRFSIGSFTAAKKNEILVSVETGGSGGVVLYALMAYENKKVVSVISQEELNKGLDLKVVCLPGFKMKIIDKNTGVNSSVDFHDGEAVPLYFDMGVYNKAGAFLKDQSYVDDEVMDDVFVSLGPADDDGFERHGASTLLIARSLCS
ncbi:hypothetical protein [Desulfosporosinus sp. OT]|uniref:hypothetical protein n=1 Tax=Desulfosporosinus sp. OT TaxID=913865 RepID=UPI000223AE9E|nr:hypothetical protein [Desulfosporosinus sp. OT]EGW40924.1 hypothetical protein DOT_1028 [Desulfosporosinus sp. OT]